MHFPVFWHKNFEKKGLQLGIKIAFIPHDLLSYTTGVLSLIACLCIVSFTFYSQQLLHNSFFGGFTERTF